MNLRVFLLLSVLFNVKSTDRHFYSTKSINEIICMIERENAMYKQSYPVLSSETDSDTGSRSSLSDSCDPSNKPKSIQVCLEALSGFNDLSVDTKSLLMNYLSNFHALSKYDIKSYEKSVQDIFKHVRKQLQLKRDQLLTQDEVVIKQIEKDIACLTTLSTSKIEFVIQRILEAGAVVEVKEGVEAGAVVEVKEGVEAGAVIREAGAVVEVKEGVEAGAVILEADDLDKSALDKTLARIKKYLPDSTKVWFDVDEVIMVGQAPMYTYEAISRWCKLKGPTYDYNPNNFFKALITKLLQCNFDKETIVHLFNDLFEQSSDSIDLNDSDAWKSCNFKDGVENFIHTAINTMITQKLVECEIKGLINALNGHVSYLSAAHEHFIEPRANILSSLGIPVNTKDSSAITRGIVYDRTDRQKRIGVQYNNLFQTGLHTNDPEQFKTVILQHSDGIKHIFMIDDNIGNLCSIADGLKDREGVDIVTLIHYKHPEKLEKVLPDDDSEFLDQFESFYQDMMLKVLNEFLQFRPMPVFVAEEVVERVTTIRTTRRITVQPREQITIQSREQIKAPSVAGEILAITAGSSGNSSDSDTSRPGVCRQIKDDGSIVKEIKPSHVEEV